MKLNHRIWLIIVPIVIIVALLIGMFIYEIEKKAFINTEKINFNL